MLLKNMASSRPYQRWKYVPSVNIGQNEFFIDPGQIVFKVYNSGDSRVNFFSDAVNSKYVKFNCWDEYNSYTGVYEVTDITSGSVGSVTVIGTKQSGTFTKDVSISATNTLTVGYSYFVNLEFSNAAPTSSGPHAIIGPQHIDTVASGINTPGDVLTYTVGGWTNLPPAVQTSELLQASVHTDTEIIQPQEDGDVVTFDAGSLKWYNKQPKKNLGDLDNVHDPVDALTIAEDGHVLSWDGANSRWTHRLEQGQYTSSNDLIMQYVEYVEDIGNPGVPILADGEFTIKLGLPNKFFISVRNLNGADIINSLLFVSFKNTYLFWRADGDPVHYSYLLNTQLTPMVGFPDVYECEVKLEPSTLPTVMSVPSLLTFQIGPEVSSSTSNIPTVFRYNGIKPATSTPSAGEFSTNDANNHMYINVIDADGKDASVYFQSFVGSLKTRFSMKDALNNVTVLYGQFDVISGGVCFIAPLTFTPSNRVNSGEHYLQFDVSASRLSQLDGVDADAPRVEGMVFTVNSNQNFQPMYPPKSLRRVEESPVYYTSDDDAFPASFSFNSARTVFNYMYNKVRHNVLGYITDNVGKQFRFRLIPDIGMGRIYEFIVTSHGGLIAGTWVQFTMDNTILPAGVQIPSAGNFSGTFFIEFDEYVDTASAPIGLGNLSDVALSAPVNTNEILAFDGTKWTNVINGPEYSDILNKPTTFPPDAHTLDSHSNVVQQAPADNDVLAYSTGLGAWLQTPVGSRVSIKGLSQGSDYASVSDVKMLNPLTAGQVLKYNVNGLGDWCNGDVSYADVTGKPSTFAPDNHTLLGGAHSDTSSLGISTRHYIIRSAGGTWKNSRVAMGGYYMNANATATVITAANTWVKIAGITLPRIEQEFVMSDNNRLRFSPGAYDQDPRHFHVVGQLTGVSQTNARTFAFRFYVNTGAGFTPDLVESRSTFSTAPDSSCLAHHTDLMLNPDDTVELWCTNVENTDDITISNLYVFFMGV